MASLSYFFHYNKRPNSLKTPLLSTGTQIVIRVKDDSSVMSPVLEIKKTDGTVFDYNYCYLAVFSRFYFIDDIILAGNLWEVYTHCDVLASYRTDILNSTQYVARSSSNYDGSILDSLYTSKLPTSGKQRATVFYDGVLAGGIYDEDYVMVTDATNSINRSVPFFNQKVTSGYFVVGVTGSSTNGTGTTYFAMIYSAFKNFINTAMTLNPTDMADVSTGLANAIYNPISYITSCRWYPDITVPTSTLTVSSIRTGRYSVSLSGGSAYVLTEENVAKYRLSIDLPKHPDASDYPYLDLAPFSDTSLYFEPFGVIPLDSTKIFHLSKIWVEWAVDYCTGACTMKVLPSDPYSNPTEREIIAATSSDFGVPIPVSSLSYGLEAGAIMTGIEFYKTMYQSTMSEGKKPNYMSGEQYALVSEGQARRTQKNIELLDTIQDMAGSALGQIKTVGAPGSFLGYNSGIPFVFAWYSTQVSTDSARFGRPLYQSITLSTLSGFCLCLNASITSFSKTPLSTEYAEIINELNEGVYLE